MVGSNFGGLVGCRTLSDEGQVPIKAYMTALAVFSMLPFVLQHMYDMFVPSLHTYGVYRLCDIGAPMHGYETLGYPCTIKVFLPLCTL